MEMNTMNEKRSVGRVFIFIMVVFLVACFLMQPSWATDGHQLIGIGALQKGVGGAGVASPKDSTWVLLNPAGLVDLDRRFDFSFEYFMPHRYVEPHGLLLPNVGAGRMSDDTAFPIPALGAVFPHGAGAFGIGLFAVNGMGVDYSRSRTLIPQLFGRNFDRRTQYGVMKLGLAYAYRFESGWSVGATINLDYQRFRTDMLTLGFWETSGGNRWDDALGAGLTLGVYKDWERWRIGAAYTTTQWMTTFRKYKDLLPDPLNLPQTVQAGVSYEFTPNVEVLLDYKFIDWSGVSQIGRKPIQGGFGWKDQHVLKGGGELESTSKMDLAGRVFFCQVPHQR